MLHAALPEQGFKQISNEAAALLNKETSLTVQKSVVPKQPAPPPPPSMFI